MTMREEPTVESLLQAAAERGMPLSREDAEKVLGGVKRNRAMAEDLRKELTRELEPGVIFRAGV